MDFSYEYQFSNINFMKKPECSNKECFNHTAKRPLKTKIHEHTKDVYKPPEK